MQLLLHCIQQFHSTVIGKPVVDEIPVDDDFVNPL